MGQQQLLLIILGVVVVGIAIAVGLTMFSDSAVSANRDALTNDLVNLAARAQQYYRRPSILGGGGNSFTNLTTSSISLLTNKPVNGNGSYFIEQAGSGSGTTAMVVLQGVGTELNNGSPVAVQVFVFPDHDSMVVVN